MFMDCEPAFLRQLVCYLRLYCYDEGMYVVKEGDITECMYIIHKGRVVECSEEKGDTGKFYNTSDQFGLLQGLQYDYPFRYSYRCIWKSQVLSLRLKDWEQLMRHFPKSRDTIYYNLKRHHPHARQLSANSDLSYRDASDPQARFNPTRKMGETQTGDEFQEEHKHDQRKSLFDRNLFENYASSLTSVRNKSALNELSEVPNAVPSPSESDKVITEQPNRKGIIKYDSAATSSPQTDSEAMLEKFEKHIATVEFEDYLSNDVKERRDEHEERLVTTIDMEENIGIDPLSHPMVPYKSRIHEAKTVASSMRRLSNSTDELDQKKKRDEQLITVVNMDQGEDDEPEKPLKLTVSHIRNQEEIEYKDDDKLEKEDKEKEITTINIDQESSIQQGHLSMNHITAIDKEESVERLVTAIDIVQEKKFLLERDRASKGKMNQEKDMDPQKQEIDQPDDNLKVVYDGTEKKEAGVNLEVKRGDKAITSIDVNPDDDKLHVIEGLDQEERKDEKLVTTIDIDGDEDVKLLKREDHQLQHHLLNSREKLEFPQLNEESKAETESLITIIDIDQNRVATVPHKSTTDEVVYEGNQNDEKEVISIDIDNSKVRQKDEAGKTNLSEIEKQEKDKMDKGASKESKKYVPQRRVKYSEEVNTDKTTAEDEKSARTKQNSPTVSFKEDKSAKESEDK